jgi:multiple antibiotic resistance protein
MLSSDLTLFIGTFTTLLAIINPFEALPVFLNLMQGKGDSEMRRVAQRSCFYATLLAFFFLLFGNLLLWIFGVPLCMIRIVGGIILMRIGFGLFSPSPSEPSPAASASSQQGGDVAFVPLAMPIMFGPGAIATILGMTSLVEHSSTKIISFLSIALAIVATMSVTFLFLVSAKNIVRRIGPMGIDSATRIVGFFVSSIGVGLIFHGVVEAIQTYGPMAKP